MGSNYAVETISSLPFGMLIGAPLMAGIEAQTQAAKATIDFILQVGFLPPTAISKEGDLVPDPDPVDITEPDTLPVPNTDPSTNVGQTRMVMFSYSTSNPDPAIAPLVSPAQRASAAAAQTQTGAQAFQAIQTLFPNPAAESPEGQVLAAARAAAATANSTSADVIGAIHALIQKTATITVPLLSVVPIPYFSIEEMTIDFVAKITEAITSSSKDAQQIATSASTHGRGGWGPISAGFKAGLSTTHTSSSSRASKYQTELNMTIHVRASSESMPKGMAKVLDMLAGLIKSEGA